MIYKIPQNRLLAVKKMVKDCANYYEGECVGYDDTCVVSQDTVGIVCKYFMTSVLPSDPKLHQEVLVASEVKDVTHKYSRTCKHCGVKFKALAKNVIHCDKCVKKLLKERHKKYNVKRAKKA